MDAQPHEVREPVHKYGLDGFSSIATIVWIAEKAHSLLLLLLQTATPLPIDEVAGLKKITAWDKIALAVNKLVFNLNREDHQWTVQPTQVSFNALRLQKNSLYYFLFFTVLSPQIELNLSAGFRLPPYRRCPRGLQLGVLQAENFISHYEPIPFLIWSPPQFFLHSWRGSLSECKNCFGGENLLREGQVRILLRFDGRGTKKGFSWEHGAFYGSRYPYIAINVTEDCHSSQGFGYFLYNTKPIKTQIYIKGMNCLGSGRLHRFPFAVQTNTVHHFMESKFDSTKWCDILVQDWSQRYVNSAAVPLKSQPYVHSILLDSSIQDADGVITSP